VHAAFVVLVSKRNGRKFPNGWTSRIRRIRLLERRAEIRVPADSAIAAEVVVEGSVLLDKNHHMLDVVNLEQVDGTEGTVGELVEPLPTTKQPQDVSSAMVAAAPTYQLSASKSPHGY